MRDMTQSAHSAVGESRLDILAAWDLDFDESDLINLRRQVTTSNVQTMSLGKIQVTHPTDVDVKLITIKDGIHQGCQAVVLVPVEKTPRTSYLDLPIELRNTVYKLLLAEKKPIAIKVCHPPEKTVPIRPVRDGFRSQPEHRAYGWDKDTCKWRGQRPSKHTILQVNKQLREEAAVIAYGSNTFQFDNVRDLVVFLNAIGSNRRFLRSLEVHSIAMHSSASVEALMLLQDATNLRSVALPHDAVCKAVAKSPQYQHGTLNLLYKTATTTLNNLQRACNNDSRIFEVSDVLTVLLPPIPTYCRDCIIREARNGIDSANRKFLAKLATCGGNEICGTKCCLRRSHCKELTLEVRDWIKRTILTIEK